jgi:ankyrin repeat protein
LNREIAFYTLDFYEFCMAKRIRNIDCFMLTVLMITSAVHLEILPAQEVSSSLVPVSNKVNNYELLKAAEQGNLDRVALLLARKANIHAKQSNNYEYDALYLAAQGGHVSVVELLLTSKADAMSKNYKEFQPIHAAAGRGDKAIVQLLLDAGASVNAKNANGSEPIHAAAAEDNSEMIQFLLDKKADINTVSNYYKHPLHYASRHNSPLAAQFLLDRGISCFILDKGLNTPLHWAAERGYDGMLELLLTYAQKEKEPARERERIGAINTTLEQLPAVITALIIEYKGLEEEIVGQVADFVPYSVRIQNKKGNTPLMCAEQGCIEKRGAKQKASYTRCVTLLQQQLPVIMQYMLQSIISPTSSLRRQGSIFLRFDDGLI